MAKILDKKDYKKLEDLSKYATGLYSTRLAECNRIYTAVSAIDFEAYVNRFNSIVINSHPTTTELNDMKDLLDDVTADLGFVKGYINTSDPQVSAPAFVVAPIKVNFGKSNLIDFASGPFPIVISKT